VKSRFAWLLAGLMLALAFAALGRWQLQRGQEKQHMLDQVAAIGGSAPRTLAAAREAGGYTRAAGDGRFLTGPVLLLDNQRRGANVGVRVLAPFRASDGTALLVDLGWLAVPGDRRLPDVTLPPGPQSLSGLLAPPPAAGIAMGPASTPAGPNRRLLTRVDLAALSADLGQTLAPRILRLDPSLPLGYARDLDVLPNTLPPERHRGYALQWFGLALTTLLLSLYFAFFRRRP
jgi:cytochrome oxidase assembly protein ShyY1